MYRFLSAFLAVLLAGSCATVSMEFEEGVSPEVYFQRAQQASDQNDFQRAQDIYRLFLETGNVDPAYRVSAEYEIALLYHKMDQRDKAVEGFRKILALYESGRYAGQIPDWPRVLSLRVLQRLGLGPDGTKLSQNGVPGAFPSP